MALWRCMELSPINKIALSFPHLDTKYKDGGYSREHHTVWILITLFVFLYHAFSVLQLTWLCQIFRWQNKFSVLSGPSLGEAFLGIPGEAMAGWRLHCRERSQCPWWKEPVNGSTLQTNFFFSPFFPLAFLIFFSWYFCYCNFKLQWKLFYKVWGE